MEVDREQGDVTMDSTTEISDLSAKPSESKGAVLKILDQTIHDGGAVKYTVLWENGETTEVRQKQISTSFLTMALGLGISA